MTAPVAIVTGACSGIGLALSTHLHRQGYKVYMADIRADGERIAASVASPSGDSTATSPVFIQTDVSSFAAQAALFKAAFTSSGRISVFAANAGIDDREDTLGRHVDATGEPKEPDLKTLEVDLHAVLFGLRLFVHYARKTRGADREETGSGGVPNGGVPDGGASDGHASNQDAPSYHMIATASMAGQYPFASNPVYSAAKHALVGLVRSTGPALARENIFVDAIMPAFVPTGLAPPGLVETVRKAGHVTPMETVMKAYDELIAGCKGGQTVECSLQKLYYRGPVEFANESQKVLIEDPQGWWSGAYDSARGK